MKSVKRIFAAALLFLAMTTATLADGQMGTPLTPPPSTSSSLTGQTGTPLEVELSEETSGDETAAVDITMTKIALDFCRFLPSLF
jgi:hypothetical protein